MEQTEFIEAAVKPLEAKCKDIDVKLEVIAWGEYWTKLPLTFAVVSAPDAMVIWTGELASFAKKGLPMDLGPYTEQDKDLDLPDLLPAVMGSRRGQTRPRSAHA